MLLAHRLRRSLNASLGALCTVLAQHVSVAFVVESFWRPSGPWGSVFRAILIAAIPRRSRRHQSWPKPAPLPRWLTCTRCKKLLHIAKDKANKFLCFARCGYVTPLSRSSCKDWKNGSSFMTIQGFQTGHASLLQKKNKLGL